MSKYIERQLCCSTDDPMLDLYGAVLKMAVHDLIKLNKRDRDWATAKRTIDESPIAEKIYAYLKKEGVEIE